MALNETFESREFYTKAEGMIRKGDFRQASILIDEALKISPENPVYVSSMGLCVAMMGNSFAGEKMCRQALGMKNASCPLLLVNLGKILLSEGKRSEARDYFTKAYSLDNTFAPAALELSRMGVRKKPVLRFLNRDHWLNVRLGKIRHQIVLMRGSGLKKL